MITFLSITACSLAMLNSWLVSQGRLRPVYIVGIIVSLCFITINGLLAVSQPGLLFLIIPSVWAIITSIIGLRRIKREKCSK